VSVRDELMKSGRWDLRLGASTPDWVFDTLDYWDHILVTAQRVDVREHSDSAMLGMSIYTGILLDKEQDDDNLVTLSGPSVTAHLGDAQNRGEIPLNRLSITTEGFSAALRLALGSRVVEGSFSDSGIAGTYTGDHDFETPRATITYICSSMGGEFRVNPDGTIDAGTVTVLYGDDPTAMMVREESIGWDPNVGALPTSRISTKLSGEDWVSKVWLLGQGGGTTIVTGESTPGAVTYKDIHGNTLDHRQAVNEPKTTLDNADSRADVHLNALQTISEAVALDSGEFLIDGPVSLGDWVWVYDPPQLWDQSNEVEFRADIVHPSKIRVLGLNWPIVYGYGVYVRDKNGGYVDLSDFVLWESGASQVIVGDVQRDIFGDAEVVAAAQGDRTFGDEDFTVPDVPSHTLPWGTFSYQDQDGKTVAAIITQWGTPLNTDTTVITDGDRYEIRWARVDVDPAASAGVGSQASSAEATAALRSPASVSVASVSVGASGSGVVPAEANVAAAPIASSATGGAAEYINAAGVASIAVQGVGVVSKFVNAVAAAGTVSMASGVGHEQPILSGAGVASVAVSAVSTVKGRLKVEAVEVAGLYDTNEDLVTAGGSLNMVCSATSGFGARLKIEAVEMTGLYNAAPVLLEGAGIASAAVDAISDTLFYSNTYYDDFGTQ